MSAPAMSVYPDNDELLPMADPIDSENMVRTKGDRSCNDFGHPQSACFLYLFAFAMHAYKLQSLVTRRFHITCHILYGPIISLAGRFWAVLFSNLLLVIGLPRALGFFRRLCTVYVGGLSVAFS